MAEDFVELGIEGIDKIVDLGFHKVPDPMLHVHRHTRREVRERLKAKKEQEQRKLQGDTSSDEAPPRNRSRDETDDSFREEEYENRYQYPDARNPTYTSRSIKSGFRDGDGGGRDRRPAYPERGDRSSSDYAPRSSRPQMRSRSSHDGDRSLETIPRRSRSTKATKNDGIRGRIDELFSDSDYGMGALSLGALAGGLAAYKAGKSQNKVDPVLVGVLGALTGGLGANALEKGFERVKAKKDQESRGIRKEDVHDSDSQEEEYRRKRVSGKKR